MMAPPTHIEVSRPVQDFGHEMLFASPFPQMNWLVDHNPTDMIVIYTISPRFITAKAWKNDGFGGKWNGGYDMTWMVPTTYDPDTEDWFSFPVLIQDGEIPIRKWQDQPDDELQRLGYAVPVQHPPREPEG
jgi:hypothetical protein